MCDPCVLVRSRWNTCRAVAMLRPIDPDWNGALPHTLLVAPDGEVLYRETGEIDFLELRRKIVPALNKITPWPGMSEAR